MDALKQYIDLYRSHGNLVNSNSAPAMNDLRGKALETLENVALPAKGSENYETTDLASMLAPDYGVNIARVNIDVNPAATFHCGVPSLSTALFMLVNDIYAERENAPRGSSGGCVCGEPSQVLFGAPGCGKRILWEVCRDRQSDCSSRHVACPGWNSGVGEKGG